MKIAFLGGNVSAECVTGYVSALGLFLATRKKEKVLMLQSQSQQGKAFEEVLGTTKAQACLAEEVGRYVVGGIPYLMEKYETGHLSEHSVRLAAQTSIPGKLQYISRTKDPKPYPEEEEKEAMKRFLSLGEDLAPYVFLDAGIMEKQNLSLAEEADLVVVLLDNACVDAAMLPLPTKASAYLLCDYCEDTFFNMGNLKRYYGIFERELLPISENSEFHRAFEEGNLKDFFDKRKLFKGDEWDIRFMESLDAAAEKLLALGRTEA